MAQDLKRSNVEASKRVFLDRLTTDQQPLLDKNNIDLGPGNKYVYANVGDSGNFGIGFDCSGLAGVVIPIAINGLGYFTGKGYQRLFSTESFPANLAGFRTVLQQECIASNSPIKVMIGHHGGGANSHMACIIDGWHMESNGDYGICGGPTWNTPAVRKIITPIDDNSEWNEWWVYDGSIVEDTDKRQPMGYPLVLDYSGGRISGASLKANGVTAVCRYLYGAGTSLPYKQLVKSEADDLINNGIEIVSNFESSATVMLGGAKQGSADVQAALAVHKACGGPDVAQIYFSADWDAAPEDQDAINAYLKSCSDVLGVENTGIYGGYWPLSRALDAGVCGLSWQTEGWSGGNIDSRINLLQRNGVGYMYVDGIQCDVNEAHTDLFGAWGQAVVVEPPPVVVNPPSDPFIIWYKGATDRQLLEYLVAQKGPGDPSWASRDMTERDKTWDNGAKLDELLTRSTPKTTSNPTLRKKK